MRESTEFADRDGKEIFLGDVVRAEIEEPFQDMHGTWAEYEITKAAGGYVLSYTRSEKGCVLPFGYTATFMNQFGGEELPDIKILLWSTKLVIHGSLKLVDDGMTPEQRRDLWTAEVQQRRAARAAITTSPQEAP